MYFNSELEIKLVKEGWAAFSLGEKNALILSLATKDQVEYSKITDEYILDHHKFLKKELLKEKCELVIEEGFVYSVNGHKYRTNRDDQINMIGQKDELLADETITIVQWKTEDAGYISHTRDEWLDIYNQAFVHKKETLLKYDTLKKAVQDALTHEEILSITW
jgi:hypothetical protein